MSDFVLPPRFSGRVHTPTVKVSAVSRHRRAQGDSFGLSRTARKTRSQGNVRLTGVLSKKLDFKMPGEKSVQIKSGPVSRITRQHREASTVDGGPLFSNRLYTGKPEDGLELRPQSPERQAASPASTLTPVPADVKPVVARQTRSKIEGQLPNTGIFGKQLYTLKPENDSAGQALSEIPLAPPKAVLARPVSPVPVEEGTIKVEKNVKLESGRQTRSKVEGALPNTGIFGKRLHTMPPEKSFERASAQNAASPVVADAPLKPGNALVIRTSKANSQPLKRKAVAELPQSPPAKKHATRAKVGPDETFYGMAETALQAASHSHARRPGSAGNVPVAAEQPARVMPFNISYPITSPLGFVKMSPDSPWGKILSCALPRNNTRGKAASSQSDQAVQYRNSLRRLARNPFRGADKKTVDLRTIEAPFPDLAVEPLTKVLQLPRTAVIKGMADLHTFEMENGRHVKPNYQPKKMQAFEEAAIHYINYRPDVTVRVEPMRNEHSFNLSLNDVLATLERMSPEMKASIRRDKLGQVQFNFPWNGPVGIFQQPPEYFQAKKEFQKLLKQGVDRKDMVLPKLPPMPDGLEPVKAQFQSEYNGVRDLPLTTKEVKAIQKKRLAHEKRAEAEGRPVIPFTEDEAKPFSDFGEYDELVWKRVDNNMEEQVYKAPKVDKSKKAQKSQPQKPDKALEIMLGNVKDL